MMSSNDTRLKSAQEKLIKKAEPKQTQHIPQIASSMFLSHNTALVPPYNVLVDTNFINKSLENRLGLVQGMMDCLYATCMPCITDCVMAELEKLGQKYAQAREIAKDPSFTRLHCDHKGTYADDCIVNRVTANRVYIVATNDKDLRSRLRKIPGVPLMFVAEKKKQYVVERLPMGVPI